MNKKALINYCFVLSEAKGSYATEQLISYGAQDSSAPLRMTLIRGTLSRR